MSEVTIEGLRQAFLDPRLAHPPQSQGRQAGAGKSTPSSSRSPGREDSSTAPLSTSIRISTSWSGAAGPASRPWSRAFATVLGVEAIGDEACRAHEGIIRHVLKNGTKISLLVRAHRPSVREYRIERTIPNPPLVRDDHGEVSNLSPQDVLPRVEVFGQHEISELTKSGEKLTRLLDRFVDRDENLPHKKADLRRALEKNPQEPARHARRFGADRGAPGSASGPRRNAGGAFREAGARGSLKEQSLIVREERLLASIPERLASFRECLETLKREGPDGPRVPLRPGRSRICPERRSLSA